jgi:hypothetical protein
MALHVMLFSIAEYVMCSRLFTFLYLQHSECCSDWENFEDIAGDFQEVCVVFSQLPVEAFCPLRELDIYVSFKTLVM